MPLCKYAFGLPSKLDALSFTESRTALQALRSDLLMSTDPGVQSDLTRRIARVEKRLARLQLGMI